MQLVQPFVRGFQPAALSELPKSCFLEDNSYTAASKGNGHDMTALVSSEYLGIATPDQTGFYAWPAEMLRNTLGRSRPPHQKELECHIQSATTKTPEGKISLGFKEFALPDGGFDKEFHINIDGTTHKIPLNAVQLRSRDIARHRFLLAGALFYTGIPEDVLYTPELEDGSELLARGQGASKLKTAKDLQLNKKTHPLVVIEAYDAVIKELERFLIDPHKGKAAQVKFLIAHCQIEQAKQYMRAGRVYYERARWKLYQAKTVVGDKGYRALNSIYNGFEDEF